MIPLERLVLIDKAIFGEPLHNDDIVLSLLLFFLLLARSLLRLSSPTIFSMKAADSFYSPPPLATLEPRLAYVLGVVEFPVFLSLFSVIGSLFEHCSTAGSLARIRTLIGGATRTPPSRNRANKTYVLWNFISYRRSALFTWMVTPHSSVQDESDQPIELNPNG